jgi:SAM-dependent methyltransferase
MREAMGWESAYRGEGDFEGPPPWNIGEPQPELAALIRAGKVRSDVLDVGCGYAELSLTLAADGYTVHGIDLAPTAIAAATRSAADRGLRSVTFQQEDVTTIAGFDGRFNTVLDSALFHTLPVDQCDDYLRSVSNAAAPGAGYYILVFAKGAFRADMETATKPNEVDEEDLRAIVSKYWVIDEIRPAFFHANPPQIPGVTIPPHERDEKGRVKFPAYLLSAHKTR